jgi:hypothetical protein
MTWVKPKGIQFETLPNFKPFSNIWGGGGGGGGEFLKIGRSGSIF